MGVPRKRPLIFSEKPLTGNARNLPDKPVRPIETPSQCTRSRRSGTRVSGRFLCGAARAQTNKTPRSRMSSLGTHLRANPRFAHDWIGLVDSMKYIIAICALVFSLNVFGKAVDQVADPADIRKAVKAGTKESPLEKLVGAQAMFDSKKMTLDSRPIVLARLFDLRDARKSNWIDQRLSKAEGFMIWDVNAKERGHVGIIGWNKDGRLWCFFCGYQFP
jgi:hypothetical protein